MALPAEGESDKERIERVLATMNRAWITGPGAGTWQAETEQFVHQARVPGGSVYAETSCVITAAAAQHALGYGPDWDLREDTDPIPDPPYQVTWGLGPAGWQCAEHTLLVVAGPGGSEWVVQSMFGRYGPTVAPLATERLKSAIACAEWEEVTGAPIGDLAGLDLRAFYWVPPRGAPQAQGPPSAS